MTFEVMASPCDQCLMTPRRIVSGARAAQLIKQCHIKDVSFICHKSPEGREIACRGHFDTGVGQLSRIAERLGMIVEIDPLTLRPLGALPETEIMTHKTKQAALHAAREVLGDDAIEGVDFNIKNTGAGWTHETIPPANGEAAAAQGTRLKLVKTAEAPAPGQAAADAKAHAADAAKAPPAHKPPKAAKKPASKKDRAAQAPKVGAKVKAIGEKHGQTKGAMIQAMLSTPGGATSKEMEAATGWQPHSVRGYLGTLRKQKINVISKKLPKEPTIYRIEAAPNAAEAATEVL